MRVPGKCAFKRNFKRVSSGFQKKNVLTRSELLRPVPAGGQSAYERLLAMCDERRNAVRYDIVRRRYSLGAHVIWNNDLKRPTRIEYRCGKYGHYSGSVQVRMCT